MSKKPSEGSGRQEVAYGYGRVSTDKQAEHGVSLDEQAAEHKRYFEYRLAPQDVLWGGTFADSDTTGRQGRRRGVSGKVRFADRKAGAELLKRLLPGDHVILTRLDRGFRSFRDAVDTIEGWIDKGINIHLTKMQLDTSTGHGKFFLRMLAAFAEFERELAAERTRDALKHRKKEGKPVNGNPGYGKKMVGQKGHRKAAEDPKELEVMALIVDMYDNQCMGFEEIYRAFVKANIRTRKDNQWSLMRIWRAYQAMKARQQSPAT